MKNDIKKLYGELVEAEQRYNDLQVLIVEGPVYEFTVTAWRENDKDREIGSECFREKYEQNRIMKFIQKEITIQKQKCKDLEKRLSDCYK